MIVYKKYKFVDDYIETAVGSQGETNFYSLEECATEMNRLSEENKNLEVELIKENGNNYELKQHINSIIQLLEGVMQANEYEIEWATENNKDCSCIKYVNEEFEKIKRRLEEIP